MDLADRGGCGGLLFEALEQLLYGLGPLGVKHLAHLLPGHRRCLGAELAELLLVELAVFGRQKLRVDERRELADLHRCALHAPERLDHAFGGLEVAALQGVGGPAAGAGQVARTRAGVARALATDHRAHLGGALDPPRRDGAVVLPRHASEDRAHR